MAAGGRAQQRTRMLRRVGLVAAALALLALLFAAGGHWIVAIVLAVAAAGAVWLFMQLRTVR
jgi:hypothetical protein